MDVPVADQAVQLKQVFAISIKSACVVPISCSALSWETFSEGDVDLSFGVWLCRNS